VGASLLHCVGLADLAVDNDEQFIAVTAQLAQDLDRMQQIRRMLRERMAASPLVSPSVVLRSFESRLRDAWRAWCGGESSA
jgi:predicted O-linked N-acetylglucosamine transferase (SPINDLY family)